MALLFSNQAHQRVTGIPDFHYGIKASISKIFDPAPLSSDDFTLDVQQNALPCRKSRSQASQGARILSAIPEGSGSENLNWFYTWIVGPSP
jgi:hypothetical protein